MIRIFRLAQIETVLDRLQTPENIRSYVLSLPKNIQSTAMRIIMYFVKQGKQIPDLHILKEYLSKKNISERKEYELSPEEKNLVSRYPDLTHWMTLVLKKSQGKDHDKLVRNIAHIYDWYESIDNTAINVRDGLRVADKIDITSYSLDQVIEMAKEWMEDAQAKAEGRYLPTKKENIEMVFPNGYTMQRITDKQDVSTEGKKMEHCVGNYCKEVATNYIQVYSLRDENNNPLVTIGIDNNGIMNQCKGIRDSNPVPEYGSYINTWLKKHPEIKYYSDNYAEELNLKDINDISPKDIEEDPSLQEIVNKKLINDEYISTGMKTWIIDRIEENNVPEKTINGLISCATKQNTGDTPIYPSDIEYNGGKLNHFEAIKNTYLRERLESGKFNEQNLNTLYKSIMNNYIPFFAKNYISNVLESGNIPEIVVDDMYSRVVNGKMLIHTESDLFISMIKSGKMPQKIIDSIVGYIKQNGVLPIYLFSSKYFTSLPDKIKLALFETALKEKEEGETGVSKDVYYLIQSEGFSHVTDNSKSLIKYLVKRIKELKSKTAFTNIFRLKKYELV